MGDKICEALRVNSTLQSLSLDNNQLCGIYLEHGTWGNVKGTYTAEGINKICEALKVNSTLQSISLGSNQLCGLNMLGNGTYTSEGIDKICAALRVNSTLKSLSVGGDNGLDAAAK